MLKVMSEKELAQKSVEYRKKILKYIYQAKAGHTGGSLSCIDILNVLYNYTMNVDAAHFGSPDRDRYIQSKGHTVEALYVVLASRGFFRNRISILCADTSRITLATRPVRCAAWSRIPAHWATDFR